MRRVDYVRHAGQIMVSALLEGIPSSSRDPMSVLVLRGVSLAMTRKARRSLISWHLISSRLLSARFQHRKLLVVVGYASTEVSEDEVKNEYYDALHDNVEQVSPHDLVLVLTDANAKNGPDKKHILRKNYC